MSSRTSSNGSARSSEPTADRQPAASSPTGSCPVLLAECFEHAGRGQVVLDARCRVVAWNSWMERHSAVARDAAHNRRLEEILDPVAPRLVQAVRAAVERGLSSCVSRVFTPHALPLVQSKRDAPLVHSVTVTAIRDSAGDRFCVLEVVDVSQTIQREEALERQRETVENQTKELERINLELELKIAELDHFAYAVSHDLKEPLRSIMQCGDFLVEDLGEKLPDNAGRSLGHITGAVHRLSGMVDDLLELCNAGAVDLDRRPVSLKDCADDAILALQAGVETSGATIHVDDLPVVHADRSMISFVYQNLISNSLKFARDDEPPRIRITAEPGALHWVFGVIDNGVGISPNKLSEIFEPLKKLHLRSRYEGNGIGLAICRKAIERHGGKIWAESDASGSRFFFTLSPVPAGID